MSLWAFRTLSWRKKKAHLVGRWSRPAPPRPQRRMTCSPLKPSMGADRHAWSTPGARWPQQERCLLPGCSFTTVTVSSQRCREDYSLCLLVTPPLACSCNAQWVFPSCCSSLRMLTKVVASSCRPHILCVTCDIFTLRPVHLYISQYRFNVYLVVCVL